MRISLLMDNVPAVYYINKMRGTKSPVLAQFALAMVSQPQFTVGGSSHSQRVECQSRSGVMNPARSQPMASISSCFQSHKSDLVAPRVRPLCFSSFSLAFKICQLETRPRGRSIGCIFPRLEQGAGLCFPPFCFGRALSRTSPSSGGTIPSPCSSCLANTAMVCTSSTTVCS